MADLEAVLADVSDDADVDVIADQFDWLHQKLFTSPYVTNDPATHPTNANNCNRQANNREEVATKMR